MTYTVSIDVDAPIEVYDAFHAEHLKQTGGRTEGLLAHVAWPTPTGIRLLEVWVSKEMRDRSTRDVVPHVKSALAPGLLDSVPAERLRELDTRGLIIPSAGLAW